MLTPVAPDRPCGADLEYDGEFLALQQAAAGRPERRMGSEVLPGEEPNWKTVRQLGQQLLARTKDLRVAVPLCRALLHTDGHAGFAEGLLLLHGLLEQFWPALFPLLDADDGDDPTMRVNVLVGLCDAGGLLKSLREVPLVVARVAGSFAMRDVDVAAGRTAPPAGTTPPTAELIRAAFLEAPLADLQARAAAVQAATETIRRIGTLLDAKLGGRSPDLRPLIGTLVAIGAELTRPLEQRGVAGPAAATATGGEAAAPARTDGAPSPGGSMQIQSRDDVIAWLDRICEFYRRTEPSSPVPILLQRARGLVNKTFLDVIRDLVPDALAQAEAFRGATASES